MSKNTKHPKPYVWRIGNVTITRIVEIETFGGQPDLIFAGLEPEHVQKIGWLYPHYADASGKLNYSIHTFVVESNDEYRSSNEGLINHFGHV